MPVPSRVIEMAGSDTAAAELMSELRPALLKSKIRAVGHDVVLAIYDRTGKKTLGGLYMPGTSEEDKFQGKVGLVLALGPLCSDALSPGYDDWFGGDPPKIGDWVGINRRDGMSFLIGQHTCHVVEWKYLRFAVETPDMAM